MVPRLNKGALALYLVFGPQDLRPDQSPSVLMRAAVAGGVTCLQWRDKSALSQQSLDDRANIVGPLVELARSLGTPFLINDDVELAAALQADGVHLGQDDMAPCAARQILGAKAIIGWSVGIDEERARLQQLEQAAPGTVDYIGVGPAFPTGTKSDAGDSLGAEGIRNIIRFTSLPSVAIGGISVSNCGEIASSGVDGIAVVSAITRQKDAERAAQALRDTWKASVTI